MLLVRVGPVTDPKLASDLLARLTARGLTATLIRSVVGPYVVISPVLELKVAGQGRAQMEYGRFPERTQAEALARSVRERGLAVQVVWLGSARYLITVGPYRHSVIREITKRIGGLSGQGVSVSVVPAP